MDLHALEFRGGERREAARARRFARRSARALSWLLLASVSRLAAASEIEPNGMTVPQLPPSSEVASAATAVPPAEVRLDRLIIAQHEALESQLDAHVAPKGLAPLCNLTAQLVLRGGTCEVDFGWYNVDPTRTTPPTADEVYSLLPGNDPAVMPRPDFTPGVGVQGPVVTIAKLRADPRYAGGLIGFAMIGNDKKTPATCTQTHFMDPALNPVCTLPACMNEPWIAGLSYRSTATPNAYYFLFEEKPMSATDFGNDGDFNDQVFLVTNVTCEGGSQPCDTGKRGVCQHGTTQCGKPGEPITCVSDVKPSDDICDGLDNDCDGIVDPGLACDDPAQICDRGRCVPMCDGAAACGDGMVCDQGICKATACAGVSCPVGKLCVDGACQDGCMRGSVNVACPHGQVCRVGRCVDPCAGVTCAVDQACEDGVCLPSCLCRDCSEGKACTQEGRCVDKGCENTTCAQEMTCIRGVCQDLCYFALCPSGQLCSKGQCIPTMVSATGSGGFVGIPDGGIGGHPGDAAIMDAAAEAPSAAGAVSTCTCDVGGPGAGSLFVVVLLAAAVVGRRRGGPRRSVRR